MKDQVTQHLTSARLYVEGQADSHTDGDNHTPPMVETPPSPEPTSTVVDLNDPRGETVTEEERKALIAKNNEFADAILGVYSSFSIPEGLDDMDADEESRVVKEFNRKRGIAAAPVVAEYNKWKSQLKPYETRAAWPMPAPEKYQKFLDELPEGCCW